MVSLKKDVLRTSSKMRRKKKLDTFSVFFCIFLFIFVGFAALSHIDRFLIKKVKISGERTIERGLLEQTILNGLNGRFLKIFPKNNAFIYPKEELLVSLKSRFLTINSVSISLPEMHTMSVKIEERQASFTWCEEGGADCYYADVDGLIFDKAPNFSRGVFLRFEGGLPSKEEALYYIGKFILPSEDIKMLVVFKQRAEELVKKHFPDNWRIVSYSIKEGNDLDLTFENEEGKKWKMMIAPRDEEEYSFKGGDAEGVLKSEKETSWSGFGGDLELFERNLNTILSSQAFKEAAKGSPDPLQDLDYIDLRFGKKIFYKFN